MRNEKYFLLLIAILIAQSVFADYMGTITTNSSDLTFAEQNGYDVLTLPKGEYTSPVLRDLQSRRLEHKDL